MKPVRARNVARGPSQKNKQPIKDPIEVFCRIRPLSNVNDMVCIRAKDDKTIVMTQPDSSLTLKPTIKEVHYSFQFVFDELTSQKKLFDHVALPLIKDLLQGTNGLLFTYGITSSGKTYTMAGSPQDVGILPRSLDVIFNSVQGFQAAKHVFKPDKLNGFEVQSNVEAFQDQQKETATLNRCKRRRDCIGEWSNRVLDTTVIEDINCDYSYALFVSYVEIYNNYIYDLLDPPNEMRTKVPQPKMLREDSTHQMYVFGATEVEVKSADEALEQFSRGQQRRRISHTALNAESSRSHSVFTIRVAQAPLDVNGVEVVQDKSLLTVSQLSMVDLAGSERSIRTRNTGQKLREAGNINASLMTLRTCIEVLRENQSQGASKMVPYRESKLTHLFKTFFEGEGKIRMVVCVNPRADDHDETMHVMRFAEMTQDVLITRGTPVSTPINIGVLSNRGAIFREALRNRIKDVPPDDVAEPLIFSLGPDFPPLIVDDPFDEEKYNSLVEFLTARSNRRNCLLQDLKQKQDQFRHNLLEIDKENVSLKQQNIILHMDLKAREQQVKDLERKLSSSEEEKHVVRQKLAASERNGEHIKYQLNEKTRELSDCMKEIEKMKSRTQDRIQLEKDRMRRIMEKRIAEKQAELERKMCFNEEKFRQLREILNSGDWEFGGDMLGGFLNLPPTAPSHSSVPDTVPAEPRMTRARSAIGNRVANNPGVFHQTKANSDPSVDKVKSNELATVSSHPKSVAVANPRHRRSQSSSADVWLEHKPVGNLDLGTVLQPKMKKKKSVSKLEVKDVLKNDVSKYVLTHQEQDSNGEVETQLYKADVIPSAGGGAQVIFNDIEKLKQSSPPTAHNLRKRSAEKAPLREIEDKCAVAVECHGVPSKVLRKSK